MSLINGIHHISMKTCNEEEYNKTVEFYTKILGLKVARSWDNGIMFDAGNAMIEIFKNGDIQPGRGTIRHLAFGTKDLGACVKAVTEAGYEIFVGPKEICIPSEPPVNATMAFCHGPLGEEIEFFQEND